MNAARKLLIRRDWLRQVRMEARCALASFVFCCSQMNIRPRPRDLLTGAHPRGGVESGRKFPLSKGLATSCRAKFLLGKDLAADSSAVRSYAVAGVSGPRLVVSDPDEQGVGCTHRSLDGSGLIRCLSKL